MPILQLRRGNVLRSSKSYLSQYIAKRERLISQRSRSLNLRTAQNPDTFVAPVPYFHFKNPVILSKELEETQLLLLFLFFIMIPTYVPCQYLRTTLTYTWLNLFFPVYTSLFFCYYFYMPITEELKNIKKLEAAGFQHEQSEALADIIEEAQLSGHESLKEFIRNELKDVRNEFNAKFEKMNSDSNINFERILSVTDNIDTHIKAGQYDMLIKIFAIVTGTAGILFALLKLFG